MYRLNEETRERLLSTAKKFTANEERAFLERFGWEDWMNNFTESGDGEEITESENCEIDKVLKEIFRKAQSLRRYAVICMRKGGMDEYVDIFDSEEEAIVSADKEWKHLTAQEKVNQEYFYVLECFLDEEGYVDYDQPNRFVKDYTKGE